MEKIDSRVRAALDAGETPITVVITCGADCGKLADELGSRIVLDRTASALGVMSANIDKADLALLDASPFVVSVEPDEKVSTY
jgi:hypothetical protein